MWRTASGRMWASGIVGMILPDARGTTVEGREKGGQVWMRLLVLVLAGMVCAYGMAIENGIAYDQPFDYTAGVNGLTFSDGNFPGEGWSTGTGVITYQHAAGLTYAGVDASGGAMVYDFDGGTGNRSATQADVFLDYGDFETGQVYEFSALMNVERAHFNDVYVAFNSGSVVNNVRFGLNATAMYVTVWMNGAATTVTGPEWSLGTTHAFLVRITQGTGASPTNSLVEIWFNPDYANRGSPDFTSTSDTRIGRGGLANAYTGVTYGGNTIGNARVLWDEVRVVAKERHAVTYNANGADSGEVPVDGSAPYFEGAAVTVMGNVGSLAKGGQLFAGWNTANDGSGTMYQPGDTLAMPDVDVTLYAHYETALVQWGSDHNMLRRSVSQADSTVISDLIPIGFNFRNNQELGGGSGADTRFGTSFDLGGEYWAGRPDLGGADLSTRNFWFLSEQIAFNADWNTGNRRIGPTNSYSTGSDWRGNAREIYGLYAFHRDAFLVRGEIEITDASYMEVLIRQPPNNAAADSDSGVRFVIKNGGQWYYSDFRVLGGGLARIFLQDMVWAPFAPEAVATTPRAIEMPDAAAFGTVVFDDIQYVGFAFQRYASTNTECRFGADNFVFSASITPEPQYTITYDANGAIGTPPSPFMSYEGTSLALPNPTGLAMEGQAFVEWNTQPDGTGTSYTLDETFTMPAVDVTLYAQWLHSLAAQSDFVVEGGTVTTTGTQMAFSHPGGGFHGFVVNLAPRANLKQVGDMVELSYEVVSLISNNNNPWAFRAGLYHNAGYPATVPADPGMTEWVGCLAWYKTTNSTLDASNNAMFRQGTGVANVAGISNQGGGTVGVHPTSAAELS